MGMDTTLSLKAPGASSSNNKGSKRKYNPADGEEGSVHGVSLELALGPLPSFSDETNASSATGCLDEDYSGVESLSISYLPANIPPPKEPMLPANDNLSLSLSSGTSASIVTNASFIHQQGSVLNASVSISVQGHFEEGSASSPWKPELSILSFGATEAAEQIYDWVNSTRLDSAAATNNFNITSISGFPMKRSDTCTSGINKPRRSSGTRTCQFQGCTKGARGASGLCIAHGGGRRCQREGCNKGAEGRTVFCKAHGGGRRCQTLGCTKSAEGRTDFCIAHGGGQRCSHEGCTRAARGKSGLCIKHGGGKRCQVEGCKRSAEGLSGLCISHGGGRRCKFPGCPKGAQGSTNFCKAHGGGKRCTIIGCTKGAEGSTPFCKAHGGGKRCAFQGGSVCPKSVHGGTLFCVAHGGGKRCVHPGCTRSARGSTNYCVRHGGGKRCKVEGCGKSAQGCTDFCKAHGGGTRCSWGQPGSVYGSGDPPCDKFSRGWTGLCASHKATVEDHRVHGAGSLGWVGIQNAELPKLDDNGKLLAADDIFSKTGHGEQGLMGWSGFTPQSGTVAFPEGRVHGGRLMAMLAGAVASGSQVGGVGNACPSDCLGAGHAGTK